MKTSAEYFALSERYRVAKLSTEDALHAISLSCLSAATALVLARSNAIHEALEKRDE